MLVIEDLPLALVPYKLQLNIHVPTAYKIDLSIAASLSVLLCMEES